MVGKYVRSGEAQPILLIIEYLSADGEIIVSFSEGFIFPA